MVQRKEYLDQLISWKDEQVIKVVTGIRRCGKSTLLMQFQQWLKENGVTQEQIVSVNFEELEYEDLLDYKKLHQYLKGISRKEISAPRLPFAILLGLFMTHPSAIHITAFLHLPHRWIPRRTSGKSQPSVFQSGRRTVYLRPMTLQSRILRLLL